MENLLSNKYVLYGGAAIAVIAGYMLLSGSASGSSQSSGYSTLQPSAVFTPTAAPSSTGDSTGAGTGSLGDLIGLQSAKNSFDFQTAMATIAGQTQIALASIGGNVNIAQIGANAQNQATQAGVISAMLKSGYNAITGFFNPSTDTSGATFGFAGLTNAKKNNNAFIVKEVGNGFLTAGVMAGTLYSGAPSSVAPGYSNPAVNPGSSALAGAVSSVVGSLPAYNSATGTNGGSVLGTSASSNVGTVQPIGNVKNSGNVSFAAQ